MYTIPVEIKLIFHGLCGPLDFGSALLAIKDLAEYYRAYPWATEAYKNRHLISVVEPTKRGYAKYTTLLGLIHGKHELIVNRLLTDALTYHHTELKCCDIVLQPNDHTSILYVCWPVRNNIVLHSTWVHGKKHGFTECKENGVLINRSYFVNGRICGLSQGWYINRNRRFVYHYNGIKHSNSWHWYNNGQLSSSRLYENQLILYKEWYKSPSPKIQQIKLQRINDGQYSERRQWSREGRLETVDNFFDNKPHGTCICWWHESMKIVNYDYGQLHGAAILWRNRKIIYNKFYIYGTEI